MSTVQEIEAAIEQLPREEFMVLADKIAARKADFWDEQIDADAAAGRLDFLFDEAAAEKQTGDLRDWPESDH